MFLFLVYSIISLTTVFNYSNFYSNTIKKSQKESVKGIKTKISIPISPSLTPILSPTSSQTETVQTIIKPQLTIPPKQFGGWYWNSQLGSSQRWMGTDSQGKNIWSDTVGVPGKAGSLSSNDSSFDGSISEKISEKSNTTVGITYENSNSSQLATQNEPFEASWSVDSSNGSAKITANKQLKECEGKETNPVSTGGGYEVKTAIKNLHGNICELFFSPPNTPNYEWLDGGRVVSFGNEEKTFGNW